MSKFRALKSKSAEIIISEVNLDITKWNTENQFQPFLSLSPDNCISGGKVLSRSRRKLRNRAGDTLRLRPSLAQSKSAPSAKYGRLKARLGAPKGIVARSYHSFPPAMPGYALSRSVISWAVLGNLVEVAFPKIYDAH